MRLRELEIEHYGLFAAQNFQFAGDSLQLVYGPNEAGKTTLLQLIREVLFGFPLRLHPYAFATHNGEMAAVATCELANGRRIRFRRRKGRRAIVVGQYESSGEPIDETSLNQLLGNASADLYRNIFGFSLDELSEGQESLERAKLSEALYGSALGRLAGFRQVLDELQQQQEQLFLPAATKRPINALLTTLRNQTRQLRGEQLRPRDYEQWEQELAQLRSQVQQLRQQRDDLQRQQLRCEQLAQAVQLWQRMKMLRATVTELQVPGEFPRDGLARLKQAQQARDQLAKELADFRQEMAQVCQQGEEVEVPRELLDADESISQLAEQLEQVRGFRQDIPQRQQESASHWAGHHDAAGRT